MKTPDQGDLLHCIRRGWMRFYGTSYIPARVWELLRIKGL